MMDNIQIRKAEVGDDVAVVDKAKRETSVAGHNSSAQAGADPDMRCLRAVEVAETYAAVRSHNYAEYDK